MRPYRRRMQMIFQDPYGSLNPRRRVGSIIGDPLAIHGVAEGPERKRRVQELMEIVGLNPEHYNRFPSEFSGGQRQRIGVARALALRPSLVVCDEPVSALDVSVQAQIINLLEDLQGEFGLTYVFIAHDLAVVEHVSDRVAVMYLGKVVELADTAELFGSPRHPYTAALLSASMIADPEKARSSHRVVLYGDVPVAHQPPHRLPLPHPLPQGAADLLGRGAAARGEAGGPPGHVAACHFPVAAGRDPGRRDPRVRRGGRRPRRHLAGSGGEGAR